MGKDSIAVFFKAPRGVVAKFDGVLKSYGLKRGEVFVNLMDSYTAEDAMAQLSAYRDPIEEVKHDIGLHQMAIQQLEERLANMRRSAERMKESQGARPAKAGAKPKAPRSGAKGGGRD